MADGRRITVLDDNQAALDLMRDVLEADGYTVACTATIGPALHEIRDTRPDLVIVDLLLATDQRELSGWDVVRLVRSHADLYRVPVIVVSADYRTLKAIGREALAMRDVHLLAKPFELAELQAVVRRALGAPAAGTPPDRMPAPPRSSAVEEGEPSVL
jgi:DNA-binding response OmpR family regulator